MTDTDLDLQVRLRMLGDDQGMEVRADEGADEDGDDRLTGEDAADTAPGESRDGRARGKDHRRSLGRRGEDAAALYLERCGMEVVERNWRCRFGEADIVAFDDGTLVFVEVKTRQGVSCGLPEDAVTPEKRARYERIAAMYLEQMEPTDCPVRFDVIAILVIGEDRALLRHHRSAFSHEG